MGTTKKIYHPLVVPEIKTGQMSLGDDEKIYLGDNNDFSVRYDSSNSEIIWRDETNSRDMMALDKNENIKPKGTTRIVLY